MALNTSGATALPPGRMTRRVDQRTNVYGGRSLAGVEESKEDEGEQEVGLRVCHVSQFVGESGPPPVAPELRELLTALVLNIAACRRWLAADRPDIRQTSATLERMTSDANALARLISTFGCDGHA